jgi:thioredoxin 1
MDLHAARTTLTRRSSAHHSGVRIAVIAVAILALFFLLAGCGEAGEQAVGATAAFSTSTSPPETSSPAAASGLPRLVDLGSNSCVPCQMMAPELEALAQEYAGSVDVVVVDVNNTEAGAALAQELRIRVIPAQIWFDPEGIELFRHEGYLSKEDIVARFQWLGYPLNRVGPARQDTTGSGGGG